MKKTGKMLGAALLTLALLASGGSVMAGARKDYIKGRELTQKEIAAQKALEPKLTMDPELGIEPAEISGVPASFGKLPASFDSRKKKWVTPVRDQNLKNVSNSGTCWAFSAISSAETSLLRQGVEVNGKKASVKSLDLSELQLLYFFYHTAEDSLGGTAGDSTKPTSTTYLEEGGNGIFTTFALASWLGVAEESQAPYANATKTTTLPLSLARSLDVGHMQNAYWVPMTDVDTVKQLVYKYGNVGINFYYSDNYFNFSTAAYYNGSKTGTNHAVNVVGWDDNYSKNNFNTKPSRDGAWLVKNSWGTGWGDKGYFWLSYDEKSLTGSNGFGFVYEFEAADNYNYIYQYDGACGKERFDVESGESVANVFTVKGSGYEQLKAVGLAVYTPGTTYSLQIYRNPQEGDPDSGTALLSKPQTGSIPYTGYVTIPISQEDLILDKGDTFAVVFTLNHSSGTVQVFEDKTYQNGKWVFFTNDTKPGQSYHKKGDTWTDLGLSAKGKALGTGGETIRIKAFSDRSRAGNVTSLALSATKLTLAEGQSKTLTATPSPTDAGVTYATLWTSDEPEVATVENGKVTAISSGTAHITARVGRIQSTCTVVVGIGTPELVDVTATAYRKLTITWRKVPGVDGYRVYRRTAGGNWKKVKEIKNGDTVSYTNKVPKAKTSYTFTVKAFVGSGKKRVYGGYDAQGLSGTAVPETVKLSKVKSVKKGLKVSWKKVPASGYQIYRKTGEGDWKLVHTVSSGSKLNWTDTKVKYGKSYCYTVRAFFKSGSKTTLGDYSGKGIRKTRTPGKPTLVSAVKSGSKIVLKWKKSFGAKGYVIYRKTAGEKWKELAVVKGANKLCWKDGKAKKGVTYFYTVRSYRTVSGDRLLSTYDKKGLEACR